MHKENKQSLIQFSFFWKSQIKLTFYKEKNIQFETVKVF